MIFVVLGVNQGKDANKAMSPDEYKIEYVNLNDPDVARLRRLKNNDVKPIAGSNP